MQATTGGLWAVTLTDAQHSIILYVLAVAGLALAAYSWRAFTSRTEVTARYRPAVTAAMCVTGVAALSYVVLVLGFVFGYDRGPEGWAPNADAVLSWAPRYVDWTVTVPLLAIELVAVSSLVGRAASRARTLGVVFAAGMIVTGFIGGVVIDDGRDLGSLLLWGLLSAAA